LGNLYRIQGQLEKAMAEAERALYLNPNDAFTHLIMGIVLRDSGKPGEAVEYLKKAMRLNPHHEANYITELTWAYRLLGRYEETIALLQEALVRTPNYMAGYTDLATSFRALGRYEEAIAHLLEGISHDPDYVWTYTGLVACYLQQWQTQRNEDPVVLGKALEAAGRCVTLNAGAWGHYALSLVCLNRKQHDRAITEAERTIAIGQGGDWYGGLGHLYNSVGRYEEATALAERILRRSPEDNVALSVLGHAHRLSGKHGDAVGVYREILGNRPFFIDSYSAHAALAMLYAELGRKDEAKAEAAEVLKLVPNFSVDVWGERVPYKDPAMAERDMAALRNAGLK